MVDSAGPVEVLAGVMARVGAEASAHEVMRARLARYEDPALLAALAEEASGRIEACAGPDRTREIEALVSLADVDAARRLRLQAETQATLASSQRQQAELAAERAGAASLRARVPGPLGRAARYRDHDRHRAVDHRLRASEHAETQAVAELARARRALEEARRAAEALAAAREAQARRADWLATHRAEVAWPEQLRERLAALDRQRRQTATASTVAQDRRPAQAPRREPPQPYRAPEQRGPSLSR